MDQDKLDRIAAHWSQIIIALGLDLHDPNLEGTPARVAKSLVEMCRGLNDTDKYVDEIVAKKFPAVGYDEMIVQKGIRAVGMCPHHFLPIEYSITVGYIPDEIGYVIGLSKIARIVKFLAARPVLQEQLVVDIADVFSSRLLAVGVGVVAEGKHGCMSYRGVTEPSVTVTAKLAGLFLTQPDVRAEFMAHHRNGKN